MSDLLKGALIVLVGLSVLSHGLVLFWSYRGTAPTRRRQKLEAIVDEGIALAEQMKKANPHTDKLSTAMSHARDSAGLLHVRTTDAELRKLIEIRLHQQQE